MNIKQKVRIKIQKTNIDIFSNQILLELIDADLEDADSKRFNAKSYDLPKGIIDNYNVIINGKNFCDQPIGSDIKRCTEIRKLTTGQGENYSTWIFIRL